MENPGGRRAAAIRGRVRAGAPLLWTVLLCFLIGSSGCSRVSLEVQQRRGVPVPLVKAGHPVDWWFVFKLNAEVFPGCGGGVVTCPFGGTAQSYVSGQQYAVASSDSEALKPAGGDCLGNTKNDPVGATFDEVYNGGFHYVVWNDQFYGDPKVASCGGEGCDSPWGHSKGLIAWNDAGEGLVMQVTTRRGQVLAA